MNIAMILAGGIGTRAGFGIPKQFVEVLGRPMIAYTIEAFQQHPEVDAIEVVCVESHLDHMCALAKAEGFSKVQWLCTGGATFQESVVRGLDYLRGKANDQDVLLIHYGDSPMVSSGIISDAIRVCTLHGNACPAMSQVYLAAGRGNGESTTTYIDRDRVMVLNAPQALRFGYAVQLYDRARSCGLLESTDPHTTSLMLAMGERIWFSKSSSANIKLTNPEDFALFEGWLLAKQLSKQNGSSYLRSQKHTNSSTA